jgi:hypothetical protein
MNMSYKPLSKRKKAIAKLIVDAAFAVHKGLALVYLKRFTKFVFVTNYPNEN